MIRKSKIIIAVASVASFTGQAADPALIAKGKLLFVTKICSQCHQYDKTVPAPAGIALKAPSFVGGIWGKESEVTVGVGGPKKKVKVDLAYFNESVREPGKLVKVGAVAAMPQVPLVSDDELKALAAYVESLGSGKGPAGGGIVAKGALQNFRYRVYNGSWDKLPDFEKLKPVTSGKADSGIADTNLSKKRDNFGIVIEGELPIKTAGKYQFKLASDDGSRLRVNGRVVIDNDGVHGVVTKTGSIDLKPGNALVRIEFFEKGGGEHLSLDLSGPGIKKLQLARNTAPQGGKKPSFPTGNPIKPVNGEAVMYRNFIQGATPRGIGVGYPELLNICFDANVLNYAMLWHGPFMDGARHWNGRGQGFQPPSGYYLVPLQKTQPFAQLADDKAEWPAVKLGNNDDGRAQGMSFRGYRLVEKRRPVFLYSVGDIKVEDYAIPQAGAFPSFIRQITLTGSGAVTYLAAAGDIEPAGNAWSLDKKLKISFEDGAKPVLIESGGRKELRFKLNVKGKSTIRQKYEWDFK